VVVTAIVMTVIVMAAIVVTVLVVTVLVVTAIVAATLITDCVGDVRHRSAQRWAQRPGQITHHLAELVGIRVTAFE
jgi:hypothetical protein